MDRLEVVVTGIALIALAAIALQLDGRLRALEAYAAPTDVTAVLVGVGCDGPEPIAVAVEEDLLPRCESIEVHAVALGGR
jgi:hypothetical protein